MSALALDIGTYSIKALAGKPGPQPTLERVVESFNSLGVAIPYDDAASEKLKKILDSVLNDNKLPRTDVRLALPETVVSTKVIEIPPLSDAELSSAIGWQAERHIPIPPEELSLEYQVLYRPARQEQAMMRVLLIGSRRQVVERYLEVFNDLAIDPSLIETQILAVIRSLQFQASDPTSLVAHFGASSMDLALVARGELQFVVSHPNGGQLLTRTLETNLNLDAAQAEDYKRSYGLSEDQFGGKVKAALDPAVSVLVGEMRKAMQYYLSQHPREAVKSIVLSGGTAVMPGLVQRITSELGVEALIAAPFTTARGQVPDTVNQPAFAVAMGLLLRKV